MIITPNFNKYINALIKEFNNSNIQMTINIDNEILYFIPNKYSHNVISEIFKEISLFPIINNKRISFKEIQPKELLECVKRFKVWASLNGYMWLDDENEWNRLYELYK
jgi:hypothetical protein